MSDWRGHAVGGIIFGGIFLLLVLWIDHVELAPLDIVALFAYDLPDSDARKVRKKDVPFVTGGTKHRHWFWHSCLIPLIVFAVAVWKWNFPGLGTLCFVIASHLLLDLKLHGKKGGTYCIYIRHGKRLNAKVTDMYLAANFVICLTLGMVSLFL